MSKKDLLAYYIECLKTEKDHDMDKSYDVGLLNEFTLESIYSMPTILIENYRIFVTETAASIVHSYGVNMILFRITEALLKLGIEFHPMTEYPIMVKNKFYCHSVFRRQADFGFRFDHDNKPILGEVSFTNESFRELLAECVLFLTEYVNCNYVIGMKISSGYEKPKFVIDFFILERINFNYDPKKSENLIDEFKTQTETKSEQRTDLYSKEKIINDYNRGDMSAFNAKIIFITQRSQDDLSQIEFNLKSKLLDPKMEEKKKINVIITEKDLKMLYNDWKDHVKERSSD